MLMGFDVQISNNRISSTISFLSFSLQTLDIYSNQRTAAKPVHFIRVEILY